jgi:hypothetical protein
MRQTLGAALILLSAASTLEAAGSMRVADLKSLPGAGDVAFEELEVIAEPRGLGYVLTLLFDSDEIVSHRLEAGSSLIEVERVRTCDGPRRLALLPSGGSSIKVRGVYVCSLGNEVVPFDVGLGGGINVGTPTPTGTDPSDIGVVETRGGTFVLVANRGSGNLASYALDRNTGTLSAVGAIPIPGAPSLVDVNADGIAVVGNDTSGNLNSYRLDPHTGTLSAAGFIPLPQRPTALASGDERPGASPNSTHDLAGRGQLLYVGVRSNQMGVPDEIRTFRVGADGELSLLGSTPAGSFLTDIEVGYDTLFAVTVNAAGRDEVRAYRRVGTQLILDASIETPEAPSLKRIAIAPSQGRVTTVFVTGFQAGWLRSIEYTRDNDPTCTSAADVLCMNGSRFEISVDWSVSSQSRSGKGIAIPLTSDTGYFWFFTSNNVELVIKVVDGRAFNNFFWVFYGALSDVEYTITVTDSATGRVRRYENPQGRLASVADVSAFPGSGASTTGAGPPGLDGKGADLVREKSGEVAALLSSGARPASPNSFTVRIDWRVPSQGTSGNGRGVVVTSDTAYFWFFTPNNVEVVIKIVDGRAVNNHFWVFYGALSDVEYTITVTNNDTGAQKTYFNPSGTLASVADTTAF